MWVLRWQVQSHSNPNRSWTVAVDEEGRWGCNCPQGKYHRDRGPCKHVREVQAGPATATKFPSQEPGRTVASPPAMTAPATAAGSRLRNVKEVYAELGKHRAEQVDVHRDAADGVVGLLSALEDSGHG